MNKMTRIGAALWVLWAVANHIPALAEEAAADMPSAVVPANPGDAVSSEGEDNFGELYLSVLTEKKRMNEERADYGSRLDKLAEEKKRLQGEIATLKSQLAVSSAPAAISPKEREEMGALRAKVVDLTEENKRLQREALGLKGDLSKQMSVSRGQEGDLSRLKQMETANKELAAALKDKQGEKGAALQDYEKQIAELKTYQKKLKGQVEMLTSELNRKTVSASREAPDTLRKQSVENQKTIEKLQDALIMETAKRNSVEQGVEALKATNEKLTAQLRDGVKEQENIRKELTQKLEELVEDQNQQRIKDSEKIAGLLQESNRRLQEVGHEAAVAHYNLGVMYMRQSDYVSAADEFRYAITNNPKNASAHYNLAVIYDAYLAKPFEAIPHYETYTRLIPSASDAKKVEYRLFQLRLDRDAGIGKDLRQNIKK